MMAGAGQLDSPTCAEGNASSNSPRFDINEFLKTPKDAIITAEDQFFNFATFNLPHNVSTAGTTVPALSRPSRRSAAAAAGDPPSDQADFTALLATVDPPAYPGASDTLIAFDEIDAGIAKDSFSLFSHDHDAFAGPLEVPPAFAPAPGPGPRLPYAGAYTAEDAPAGLNHHHRAYVSLEPGASTSGGAHAPAGCAGGAPQVAWGLAGPTPPPPPSFGQTPQQQFQCASCQILRRIIHSNGVQDTKLEIHGCDGQSYHAVLQTRFCIDDGFPASFEQQMVEFPVGNAEYVKQFLLQYSLLRRKEGFVLRQDSVASHGSGGLGMALSSERVMGGNAGCMPKQMGHMVLPDILCNSSDFSNSGCVYGKAGLGQNKVHRSGSMDSTDNADATIGPAKPPKSNAAAQRERTGKLKMTDLAQHFHLPINAAAKELGICPTVLKKICRRNGMRRWPHRKIKSIERIIATLEQTIAEGAGQGDEGICMEIAMLRNERAQLCAGFLGET